MGDVLLADCDRQIPELCDNITIGTYPYEFRGFMGFRNFFMEDDKGERIIRANSIWSLMDLKAGRLRVPRRKW